jgi:hypothetical protein
VQAKFAFWERRIGDDAEIRHSRAMYNAGSARVVRFLPMDSPLSEPVRSYRLLLWALTLCLAIPTSLIAQTDRSATLDIPRLTRAPRFEEFLGMRPPADLAAEMSMVTGFVQRQPSDGRPASERTEVYLGYDDLNLYAVFVCFDSDPSGIRARLNPRGDTGGDDWVVLVLDTFRDQRNAYMFGTSPLGVEWDALFTEGQGPDANYDTLYESEAGLTEQGYVVWMAMPFKSLRFPADSAQTWGVQFGRSIPRFNEQSFWPGYSTRIEGRLNQAATAQGLEDVSPGRNIQLLPFTGFRSFRAIDRRDPARPVFETDRASLDAGLDAKIVFRDSLVTDITLNPDFSQVESDEPQVTTNERFEVLFPEKRPFFLENASFFQTPINLVFTRRIADPQFGARLTGKAGPYSIGALVADDQAPGKRVPEGHPQEGKRGRFSILRLNRDIFDQSSIGMIFTEHAFDGAFNRVGGADARIKLNENWVTELQAVTSTTRLSDGSGKSGPAYEVRLNRAGRQFNVDLAYVDRSAGFVTETGFNPRDDIRSVTANAGYAFRPEGETFIAMTPDVTVTHLMARDGTRLEQAVSPRLTWEFSGQTFANVFYLPERLRLRPSEARVSTERDFRRNVLGFAFETAAIAEVQFSAQHQRGGQINFSPVAGQEASMEDWSTSDVGITVRPGRHLSVSNRYLFTRLGHRTTGATIFNDHIIRSRWNWQFTPELSVRVILQYEALLANLDLTSLETRKNFNADFLVAYQLNAWTAFYAGFNDNLQNIDLVPTATGSRIIRTPDAFMNDAHQFFAKFSYLVRF